MSHWFAGLQDSCRALEDVLGSSNPECYIGPKQKCLGISELTCHLENQCWGANISIDIFQLNQHWKQMHHFISSINCWSWALFPSNIVEIPSLIFEKRGCVSSGQSRGVNSASCLILTTPLYIAIDALHCVYKFFWDTSSGFLPVDFLFGTPILF